MTRRRRQADPRAQQMTQQHQQRRKKILHKKIHADFNELKSSLTATIEANDEPAQIKIARLEKKLAYQFKNKDVAAAALDISELSDDHIGRAKAEGVKTSCQNLAILGDLALELALADRWIEIASTPMVWEIAKRRVTPNIALAVTCMQNGLHECYGGEPRVIGHWVLATIVEAVLGAVYMDSGKSIAAVQAAMGQLDILQAGMAAMQEAEIIREKDKTGKRRRRVGRREYAPVMDNERPPGVQTGERTSGGQMDDAERFYVVISDSDEDLEDAGVSNDDTITDPDLSDDSDAKVDYTDVLQRVAEMNQFDDGARVQVPQHAAAQSPQVGPETAARRATMRIGRTITMSKSKQFRK